MVNLEQRIRKLLYVIGTKEDTMQTTAKKYILPLLKRKVLSRWEHGINMEFISYNNFYSRLYWYIWNLAELPSKSKIPLTYLHQMPVGSHPLRTWTLSPCWTHPLSPWTRQRNSNQLNPSTTPILWESSTKTTLFIFFIQFPRSQLPTWSPPLWGYFPPGRCSSSAIPPICELSRSRARRSPGRRGKTSPTARSRSPPATNGSAFAWTCGPNLSQALTVTLLFELTKCQLGMCKSNVNFSAPADSFTTAPMVFSRDCVVGHISSSTCGVNLLSRILCASPTLSLVHPQGSFSAPETSR